MCASRPLATDSDDRIRRRWTADHHVRDEAILDDGSEGRDVEASRRDVHSAPTSKDVLRSGFRSGLPWLICVRPPTMVVVYPVSISASAGMNAAPEREVRAQILRQLVLDADARIEDGEVAFRRREVRLERRLDGLGGDVIERVRRAQRPCVRPRASACSRRRRRRCACCCRPRTAPRDRPFACTNGSRS